MAIFSMANCKKFPEATGIDFITLLEAMPKQLDGIQPSNPAESTASEHTNDTRPGND